MECDQYGYPLTDVLANRFHPPVALSSAASAAERHAHQSAYNAYQERFRIAYVANYLQKQRGRSD